MTQPKYRQLTNAQYTVAQELILAHGLLLEQISFDGDDPTPIFDHNATSILSLKLTDIRDISPVSIQQDDKHVTVFGKGVLQDGRERGGFGSCEIGETLANGQIAANAQIALGVASSRCYSQIVRNLGVKLYEAHKKFMETGEIAAGSLAKDPRHASYAELHILGTELDLIVDGDKTKYTEYLAENYDGRISAADLTDIELQRMLITFRSLARLRRGKQAA